jgi:ring-1,2-phenylacetyl-CoA epoxidase subunit PaaC
MSGPLSEARDAALFVFLLRLGDSALVLGQRLAGWTAHGPALEEDLALTNVALDLVGHARMWLDYAGEVEGRGRDADRLAYFRDQSEYRNVLLVERPNGNYADTTARQFLFDTWHLYLLQALGASRDERISAIASKAAREAAYHVRRSQAAIGDAWPYTGEFFAPDAVDDELLARGVACDLRALYTPWDAHVSRVLQDATLTRPDDGWMHAGGKTGKHTEALGYLLAEMQSVARSVPAARW